MRRGGITVIVAAAFVFLLVCLAMAADLGLAANRKQRLVNACDAAALAGGTQLPDATRAQSAATEVMAATFTGTTYSVTGDTTEVVVTASESVSTLFARAAGLTSIPITARARVTRPTSTINQMNGGIAPWAVTSSAYAAGAEITLKQGGGGGSGGNYQALALGGTGASNYEDRLKYGYTGTLGTGDDLGTMTEPGAITGPTRDAVEYRIALATSNSAYSSDTPTNYSPTNPRILIVPMVESWVDVNGRNWVNIVGFAAVYLIGVNGSSVTAQFVSYTSRSAANNSSRTAGTEYGVGTYQLVE